MHYYIEILILLCLTHHGYQIKKIEVDSDKGQLYMDRSTEVRCNYVKWKSEQLFMITWSLEYDGVATDILRYSYDGNKETPSSTFVVADLESADFKKVDLRVLHGSEPENLVDICCEVRVLENEYGRTIPREKKSCSKFTIVKGPPPKPIEVDIWSSHTTAEVGDKVDISCRSLQSSSLMDTTFAIRINGRKATSGHVIKNGLETRVTLMEDHFKTDLALPIPFVTFECQAYNGPSVVANSSLIIERASRTPKYFGGGRQSNSYSERYQTHHQSQDGRGQGGRGGLARHARFWADPSQHRSHKHGVPCQSYILLESTHRDGSVIIGQLPGDIMEDIPSPQSSGDHKIQTSTDVVTILNILGYHGYNVVGVGNTMDNRMVWTLSRKYFEFHDEL